jgi:hypothetical protein
MNGIGVPKKEIKLQSKKSFDTCYFPTKQMVTQKVYFPEAL